MTVLILGLSLLLPTTPREVAPSLALQEVGTGSYFMPSSLQNVKDPALDKVVTLNATAPVNSHMVWFSKQGLNVVYRLSSFSIVPSTTESSLLAAGAPDREVMVAVTDRPLREVMEAISDAVYGTWQVRGKTYVLIPYFIPSYTPPRIRP